MTADLIENAGTLVVEPGYFSGLATCLVRMAKALSWSLTVGILLQTCVNQ